MKKRRSAAIAGCLVLWLALVAAVPAETVMVPWTWEQVDQEWEAIRSAVPAMPALGGERFGEGQVYITRSGGRGWALCLARQTIGCYAVLIGLPDIVAEETWRATLWHEAGHAHHLLFGIDWHTYGELRKIDPDSPGIRETYAEDFRYCFGPVSRVRYRIQWIRPDPDICEWMLNAEARSWL